MVTADGEGSQVWMEVLICGISLQRIRVLSHERFWAGRAHVRIAEACEVFIRHCGSVRKLSEHTTRAYRLDLKRVARFAGVRTRVASCDRATLQRYVVPTDLT